MRLFLGLDSLAPGNGGICRVARLVARVVAEEVAAGRLDRATAGVLKDSIPPSDVTLPVRVYGGSRLRFVAGCCRAKITNSHAFYDFVGLAAAHSVLPFPRRPFLTFIYGIEVWKEWASPKYARSADRAAMLVSISAYTRDRASRWHPPLNRATICWLGTEEDDPPTPSPPIGPPRATIIGRLDSDGYKGHHELITAWPTVRAAVPNAVLTVVGHGPTMTKYQQLAAQLALPPTAVEFRGFVPECNMPALWASTHVLAMPSRGEGFGLVYIEAMRHGRPVIASIHDAAPEINIDGLTGYNVDLDRPGNLADQLVRLLRDPDRCAELGGNGRQLWAKCFRYSAFRDRFAPILHDFLARR